MQEIVQMDFFFKKVFKLCLFTNTHRALIMVTSKQAEKLVGNNNLKTAINLSSARSDRWILPKYRNYVTHSHYAIITLTPCTMPKTAHIRLPYPSFNIEQGKWQSYVCLIQFPTPPRKRKNKMEGIYFTRDIKFYQAKYFYLQ